MGESVLSRRGQEAGTVQPARMGSALGISQEERMYGTVKWYNRIRGYGFIGGDDGRDYFLYYGNFTEPDRKRIPSREGARVEFDPEESIKGPKALNVTALND